MAIVSESVSASASESVLASASLLASSQPDPFCVLAGAQRDEAYMTLEREVRRIQAAQAAMLSEVTRSHSFLDDHHHSPASWLQAVTNSSKSTAQAKTQTAALLAQLPVLAAAVAAGEIGDDQLQLLRRLWANTRCRDQLPDSEEVLVGYARSLTLHEFRQVCQRWQAHADPDGAHRDHETSRENRHVARSRVGAGHLLHAEGDALSGDIISSILDAHADAEFNNDILDRLRRFGDGADQHPLARTATQRTYDALIAIFLKAAGTTETTTQVPLVNIFCTESVLSDAIRDFVGGSVAGSVAGSVGATGPRSQPDGRASSQRLRLCETASGAPVDPHDLVIAALVGQVRRVVVDSAGRVLDLGRRRRLFVGAAREAVLLMGDRCSHPGCEQRSGQIQIDHLAGWASRAGPTNPFNGGPTCPRHNRAKERGRFTVVRDEDGWHHFRPDGTEIAPRAKPRAKPC